LILYLVDLKAVEIAPLVEQAYQADVVDLSVLGDYEDFQIEVGLLKERLTPPPRFHWARDPKEAWEMEKKRAAKKDSASASMTRRKRRSKSRLKKSASGTRKNEPDTL